ncbi:MAG: cob(I)yrinic acid a,c-diamide adenosyltransferase [bacterium]
MIQVYTGYGKGKTTAALGLALRAAGAGFRVYIIQFLKKGCYSEIKALRGIKNIRLQQYGRGCFLKKKPTAGDFGLARKGLQKAKQVIINNDYRVVILDEINVALKLGLLKIEEVASLLKNSPKNKEIILTGRYLHPRIKKLAHLVSEIKEVKHYFRQGIKCRKGFDC